MSHPTGGKGGGQQPPPMDFEWKRAEIQAQQEKRKAGDMSAVTDDEIQRALISRRSDKAWEEAKAAKVRAASAAATSGTRGPKPPVPPRPQPPAGQGGGSPKVGRKRGGSDVSL